jgi:hypothetical protein
MRNGAFVARRTQQRARGALRWGVVGYLALQLALGVIVEKWHPNLSDLEFGSRLALLKVREAEEQGCPLLLMVGSSRCMEAFRPEILPPVRTAAGKRLLVFNCSHTAAGPLLNLMMVTRLLRQGIRPDWLFVEIMPPFLSHEWFYASVLEADDLPVLGRHVGLAKLGWMYLHNRLTTNHALQQKLFEFYAPDLMGSPVPVGYVLERLGGPPVKTQALSAAEIRRRTAITHRQYFETLQHYQISPRADQATRALLELCRQHHIRVALLLMPEGSTLRSWYPAEACGQLERFLAALHRDYLVPIIDARLWLSDDEMYDSHHASSSGAERFTRRFGREVLQTMVERDRETPPPQPATETVWRKGSNARFSP